MSMELIKPGIHLDFVGKMKYAVIFSAILIIIGIGSVIYHGGLNPGIDFAGGSIIQVKFSKAVSADQIRTALKSTKLENSIIQQFGVNEFLIRTSESFSDQNILAANVGQPLTAAFKKDFEIRRVEVVGSKVGADFTRKAIIAVILSWLAMLIYVGWRFEFRYAVGGIVALVHDVIITMGAVSIMNMEFTISILASLIFIIGFSINDTIVTLDRIRENVKLNPKQKLGDLINMSVNQTLSRTILTSLTVFFTVLALYIFGGAVIRDLAFPMLVGVVIGTYSSIYIACTIVLFFEKDETFKNEEDEIKLSSLAATGFVVFILILFVGIYLSLFGLPGTIIIFLDVLIYALVTGFEQVGWKVLLFLLVFSILAETIDFLTGLTRAHKAPVFRKSLWGTAIGAAVGMMMMTPFLWGLGIWGGFFLGGLAGLLFMEISRQSRLRSPHQATNRAIFAMIGRKAVKGSFALIMIFVSLINLYS